MSLLRSERLGSQRPSHLLLPTLAAASEAAETAIDLASIGGLDLDEWQRDVLRGAMAKRPGSDCQWAAFEVGIVVTRQSGKGSILEARQLAGLFDLNERLQIHSAHEFKTCYEHFRRMKDMVLGNDLFARHVEIIRTGAGDQSIELKNGNRIRFIARSRSSGRGFSGDVVYLDEAFKLSESTMGALLPTLSARPNPQIWYTSSAPHLDSEVLHRVRERGVRGGEGRLFYAEWSCEPEADPADRENWYRSNPALGIRITEESVESEFHALSPDEFARERLGIAEVPPLVESAVPLTTWATLADEDSCLEGHRHFALDVSPDRRGASYGVAGRRHDGLLHVETVHREPGTAWVLDRGVELFERWRTPIRIDKGGPAASFIALLRERGVEVVEVSTAEHAQACGQFIDAAANGGLRHLGQMSLDSALRGAVLRATGDSVLWGRRSSKVDITPLVAVTLALGGVPRTAPVPEPFFVYT
jgi:hypothetical protein